MICKNCGAANEDQDLFCKKCGSSLHGVEQPNHQPIYQQPSYYQPQMDNTPITMWGYFGYQLLFSIPCVGFICLLIFAFGGTKNINVRNFARSYFCYLIIMVILLAIIAAIGGIGLGSFLGSIS